MKKVILSSLLFLFVFTIIACNNSETNPTADTTSVPAATDTMPVLHPGNVNSEGTIKTPATGDNNVIMPDSAISH